jgi:hypothetical protein
MHQEGKCGTKDLCGGEPIYLRKERTTTNSIQGWSSGQQSHMGSGVTLKKILYAIFRGKLAKQVVGTSRGLRRMKKWTLWRGRFPPKRKKKKLQIHHEPVMYRHRPQPLERDQQKKTVDDCVGRERERKRWMIVITGLTGNLSGNRSGRADLKEGADVVVGE